MSAPLLTGRRRLRQQLVGLLFLGVIAGLVGVTVALYRQSFTPSVTVYVDADRVGSQLTKGGDVKARGVLVGRITEVDSTGDGARITLELMPQQIGRLPADSSVMLLPKTLFGEKFVDIVVDSTSTARSLREGDVISQDRTAAARETSRALDNLLPLLQALKPAEVSTTLNAVSTALRGRGEQIGQNLEITEQYVRGINPDLTTLGQDFGGLADFADTVDATRPDLLAVLDNLSFLSRSLVDTSGQLSTFLRTTTTFDQELQTLLGDNEQRLVRLAADSLPSLQVYQRYSPEFSCLARGLEKQAVLANKTFGGLQPGLHITVETVRDQGGYQPGDEPRYGADNGPTCLGLPPNAPVVPFPVPDEYTDGYCDDQEAAPGVQRECVGRGSQGPPAAGPDAQRDPARALSQTRREKLALGVVAGPVLGVAPDDVPDLVTLLFGPVARGNAIGLAG